MAETNTQWKFGWKRKIGAQVSKKASSVFEENNKTDDDECISNGEVDWLTLAPLNKKSLISLEDNLTKSARLTQEGSILAEAERYWEALKKWDEALLYTPCNERIHDMKAQAMMELCECFPAVQAARKAVQCRPTWWVAHQTLGRALLGLGEVRSAVTSFSQAVHINPADTELWEDDLLWAFDLLQKKEKLESEKQKLLTQKKEANSVTITELDVSDDSAGEEACRAMDVYTNNVSVPNSIDNVHTVVDTPYLIDNDQINVDAPKLKKVPRNYIQMRDNKAPP